MSYSCFPLSYYLRIQNKLKPTLGPQHYFRTVRLNARDADDEGMFDKMGEFDQMPATKEQKYIEFLEQLERQQSLQDFKEMSLEELKRHVSARKNYVFLMIEEMRRLRIQKELKEQQQGVDNDSNESFGEHYRSSLPFLGDLLTESNLKKYYFVYIVGVLSAILFGGFVAPLLEVKFGIGGLSYKELIAQMHLPLQLADVDPTVAAFCGGMVGVLSAAFVLETHYIKDQKASQCSYCQGKGYLQCGQCLGQEGLDECSTCYGTGKVMCQACLFTGKKMVNQQHSLKEDIFD